MGAFDTPSKFDPAKNNTVVKFGEKRPVLETELNELQEIQNHARADIVRQMVHSGVIDYVSSVRYGISGTSGNFGEVQVHGFSGTTYLNTIGLREFNTLVNGYKLFVKKYGNEAGSTDTNLITLSTPPTFGSREDLVFLEAWFENIDVTKDATIQDARIGMETTQRTQLKWRIRTVAGVDFKTSYSDGMYNANTGAYDYNGVYPQGANTEPLSALGSGWKYAFKRADHADNKGVFGSDVGLYVAGRPDYVADGKTQFKTADGYVYAIPLFRVKRRNSGGYRSDNVNGARDYYSVRPTNTVSMTSVPVGTTTDHTFSSTDILNFRVGDILSVASKRGKVRNISGTTVTLEWLDAWTGGTVNTSDYLSLTNANDHRPDGKFSNIIDKDDIIDLRHKVSLTGYSPQQLLDSEFDKFMRGENQVNQKITTVKERFGLTPAPVGTPVNLVPTKVLGNDGLERELVNLLGADGKFRNGRPSFFTGGTVDTYTGFDDSFSWYNGYTWNGIDVSKLGVQDGEYFLVTLKAKTNSTTAKPRISFNNIDKLGESSANWHTITAKFQKVSGQTILYLLLNTTDGANLAWFDNIAIYKIDQATYDKIDVDPLFTGEELAKKFPYVSSYPNVVENALPYNQVSAMDKVNWILTNYMGRTPSTVYYDKVRFNSTGSDTSWGISPPLTESIPVKAGDKVELSFDIVASSALSEFDFTGWMFYDSSDVAINSGTVYWDKKITADVVKGRKVVVATAPTNAVKAIFRIGADVPNIASGHWVEISNLRARVNPVFPDNLFVPSGRWFLPNDYAEGNTPVRLVDYTDHRQTFSDAQTTETRTEFVEALKTPQKNVKVTQATEGVWAVNDTIKVSSQDGVVGGLIDTDSALAKVVSYTVNTNIVTVDDVSKLAVNDTVVFYDANMVLQHTRTITAIDTTNKVITVDLNLSSSTGLWIVETTVSTSSPVVTATGIAGTWTNLGTKEATYTITTAPTTTNTTIKIDYAVHYPAGKGINNLPSENLAPKVNGLNYVSGTTLKLKANFEGKVYNSTDANPHISKHTYSNTYVSPSGSWSYEASQANYDKLKLLGEPSGTYAPSTIENGKYAQNMFSFNLIEEYERSYGRIPALTVADKVAWLKANITKLVCNWYGFGSSVGGNKANFTSFNVLGSSWYAPSSNTASIVTKISNVISGSPTSTVDANGFAHFLAYAEPSDGVTASTIETDYVELEIELNVAETGYDVFVPEETKPVLATSPLLYKEGENLLPPFNSGDWALHVNAKVLSPYELQLDATTNYQESSITFDVSPNTDYTISFDKNDKYFVVSTTAGYGSGALFNWVSSTSKTFNSGNNSKLKLYITNMDSLGTFVWKNPILTNGSKVKPFRAGAKKSRKKNLFDFLGKTAGDTFSNPHRALFKSLSTFDAPSTFTSEGSQLSYDSTSKQDGVLTTVTTSTVGAYAQRLFEFDLSHLGLSLSELKSALRKITATVVGYGSGDNAGVKTYGLMGKLWRSELASSSPSIWSGFGSSTSSSPSSINYTTLKDPSYGSNSAENFIVKDQKVYVLVHSTYPASATNPSEVFIDYVKLEVELADYVDTVKKNVVKVRNVTKELKLHYPPKSEVNGMKDAVEVWYKHMPVSDIITASTDVTILAEGDGFLASDLSTSVGTKQGTHHYLNPLYKVGDNRLDVFGNFGFANVPFASDTKGVNIGAKISVYGTGFRTGYTRQYGLPVIKKPMIGIARFLVNHAGELKMLVLTRYSNTGALELVDSSLVKGFLIAISGKPLTKDADGVSRSTMTDNTAWKTPNGEIQGYLNENGEVIATYQ